LILTVLPHEEWPDLAIAIAVALFPLAFLAARRPSFRVAPVTAIILLLAPTRGVSAFVSAADRIFEIGLGTVAGVAVSLLIFPARAYALLAQSAADALTLYGRTITVLLDRAAGTGSPDVASVASRYAAIRAALSKVETLATDARRERDSRLAAGPDPDPLARTLRRLRSDLVIMDRAVVAALPPPVHAALAPVIAPVTRDVSAFLNAAAAALRARGGPPALDAVEAAVQAYASAVGAARRDGLMRTLSDEDVSRIFTLGFALDQLRLNFRDLADRITELAKL
jgi:uncharacterized membrane protein YccC